MEGVTEEFGAPVDVGDTSAVSDSLGRRGLTFRQPRTVNVRKTLGEPEVSTRSSDISSNTSSLSSSVIGSATTTKFQPKLYVPERLRKAAEPAVASQHGASAGISSYGSGAVSSTYSHDQYSGPQEASASYLPASSSYSSRVLRGRESQPAPEATAVSTSRGVFQMRPRRNIRVHSSDELENDGGAAHAPRRSTTVEPRVYTTGFVKESTAPKDGLARRGRQTVSDMLGPNSSIPPPSYSSSNTSMDHEPQLAMHPDLERHISQSLAQNMKKNISSDMPPHLQAYQPSVPLYSIPAGIDLSSEIRCPPVGSDTRDYVEAPTVLSNGFSIGHNEGQKYNSENNNNLFEKSDMHADTQFENVPIPAPTIPLTDSYSDRIAAILGRSSVSVAPPVVREPPPANETVDEKKDRILRELMNRKMEAANAKNRPSDPNFETLEQKKERIFANLRQKHGMNTQASEILSQTVNQSRLMGHDILGLSGAKPMYSRSQSLGNSLYSRDTEEFQEEPSVIHATDTFTQGDVAPSAEMFGRYTHSMENRSLFEREPTPGQSEELSDSPVVIERDPGIHQILYSGTVRREDRQSQGASPSEDMRSVDSGFHGGDAVTSGDSPTVNARIKLESQRSTESQRPEVTVQKSQIRKEEKSIFKETPVLETKKEEKSQPKVPVKVVDVQKKPLKTPTEQKRSTKSFLQHEETDADSTEETLIKPSDVKAASGSYLRKSGPPTRPKPAGKTNDTAKTPVKAVNTVRARPPVPAPVKPPVPPPQKHQSRSQTPTKSQPPRPKSAPPSKSKSIANLSEMPSSPRMERRASTVSRDDMDDSTPFARSSRLRSSTRAWEMRQAEKQAEIRNRTTSKSSTPGKSSTPKKSVITGQVSLSTEQSSSSAIKDKPSHTPRMSSNYEKPWRTGSNLASSSNAGSFLIRSAQPDKGVLPDRPKKPISNPSSGTTSRDESPSNKPRTPLKGQGSAAHQGCLRSQLNLARSSPGTKNKSSMAINQKSSSGSRTQVWDNGPTQAHTSRNDTSPNRLAKSKRSTTPKPFRFNYIPRSRRSSVSSDAGSDFTRSRHSSVSSDAGSDVSLDIEDYLQNEEDSKLSDAQGQGNSEKPEEGLADKNLHRLSTDEPFDLTGETLYLQKLAEQWKQTTTDDLTRGISPDSGFSVLTIDSDRPTSPRSSACDGRKSFFTNWIEKPLVYTVDPEAHDTDPQCVKPHDTHESLDSEANITITEDNNENTVEALNEDSAKDDTDFVRPVSIPKTSAKRDGSASHSGTLGRKSTAKSAPSITPKRQRPGSSSATRGAAGAVDEEFFIKNFEDVPKVHIFSGKEVTERINTIKETLSDSNKPWEKRVSAIKEIRSLLIAGAADYDEFTMCLRHLEPCMTLSAKDLRSQVVREAAVTLAYLSELLGNKFDHFAETVFPTLIALIPNSAKIMATAGLSCIRFIIQHTQTPRLIPIITSSLSSKSSVIRRELLEVLCQVLHQWPTHMLERHIALLQEAIKKGFGDADSEARSHSRKAYWGFANHFQDQADSLLNSLDATKQKMIRGESVSNSSSNNSLSSGGATRQPVESAAAKAKRSRSMSSDRTNNLYSRTLAGPNPPRRASVKTPSTSEDQPDGARGSSKEPSSNILRSSSAVDLTGSMSYRGTASMARAERTPANSAQSNYSSLRFRNLRQMKAYGKRKGSDGSAEDIPTLGANRPRTLSASDLTNAQAPSSSRSSADLLSDQTAARMSRSPRKAMGPSSTLTSRPKKTSTSGSTAQSIVTPERSRPRSKIGISQSQPGSRSGSPSSRLSYLTHTTQNNASSRPRRQTAIPRSQGASRETSPSRIPRRERRLSGSKLHAPSRVSKNGTSNVLQNQLLQPGQDVELAVADALFRGGSLRKRYESYDSDDAASETSSVCSERSFSSYSKTSELSRSREDMVFSPYSQDMSEILTNLSSGSWADRKEGLVALQNLLRCNRLLNRLELKKITEIFTRMFHDPHGKVFSVFMETLIELVAAHRADLQDWLYVCLTRLINKMGADLLGSVQVKIQRALEAVRDSFPYNHQFQILNRFIVDQTQTPNLKVKVALLNYLHGLALLMDPGEFINTSDTRLAVSRIITWTTEPKSVDVRKAAQAVLIALFNLNSPEFSMMLSVLPKTFQDGATRILHNHLRSASQDSEPLAPRNITSPTYGNRYRPSPQRTAKIEDLDTENMNPEDIYNSIKKTSADIQNLSKLDTQFDDIKKERDSTSQDSGIQGSNHDLRGTSPDVKDSAIRGRHYNPSHYQDDSLNGYDKAALREAVFDVDNDLMNDGFNEDLIGEQSDIVADILKELSNHNTRTEERTSAMLSLIKITREGSAEVWDEHFKTILLLLLETLGDTDGHIRALALRVLREILRHQPQRFKEYAELTILKILEAHKDPVKEVSRAAEECATTLAHSVAADQCIRVLNPIIQTADFPINLAAIKMQTKVLESADSAVVGTTLKEVIPGLLQGYDDRESSVRKASVFCLVAIYMVIGDDLKPQVQHLSGSKMKLLNLYIKRSLAEKGQSGPGLCSTDTSKTTSPASTIADLYN